MQAESRYIINFGKEFFGNGNSNIVFESFIASFQQFEIRNPFFLKVLHELGIFVIILLRKIFNVFPPEKVSHNKGDIFNRYVQHSYGHTILILMLNLKLYYNP